MSTPRYVLPKGYRDNISKNDNNDLVSRQGLVGSVVTTADTLHRLFTPNPLRGWKTLTLSIAVDPSVLVNNNTNCLIYVCDGATEDVDVKDHLVDVAQFSSTTGIFSYYRSPIYLSENEIIIIKSNMTGVCVRAEGNDDSRYGL